MDGKLLTSFEANSSPSHIIATKGSAVWLHWNYTYIGDGPTETGITLTYKEQLIRVNSTSQPTIQTLAKRTGQNGALTLESSIPTPFNGRVEVISSNSTLVIHNLQYNDSKYQFSSYVTVDADLGAGARSTINNLRPVVSIKVNGTRPVIFFCATIMLESITFCSFIAISMRTVTKVLKLQISNNLLIVTVLLCSLKLTNRNYSE